MIGDQDGAEYRYQQAWASTPTSCSASSSCTSPASGTSCRPSACAPRWLRSGTTTSSATWRTSTPCSGSRRSMTSRVWSMFMAQRRPAQVPFGYSDEVWTGVEYQVAASLLCEHGRRRGRHRRCGAYTPRRVPAPPMERERGGHHYTRSLASWGLLTGMLGFSADLGRRSVRFDPKFFG